MSLLKDVGTPYPVSPTGTSQSRRLRRIATCSGTEALMTPCALPSDPPVVEGLLHTAREAPATVRRAFAALRIVVRCAEPSDPSVW